MSKQLQDKLLGLKALLEKLREIRVYLEGIVNGKYKYNSVIIRYIQDIQNLLPNLKLE